MTTLILIAVVGALGSLVLCRVTRTETVCDTGLALSTSVRPHSSKCAASDGDLAAMIARNHQGVLGDEQQRT